MAREICSTCEFPIQTCICSDVVSVDNAIKIIVLQHSDEVKNKKNTIKLAQLALTNIDVYVGKQAEDFAFLASKIDPKSTVLMYPSDHATNIEALATVKGNYTNNNTNNNLNAIQSIIILDGTWRKAKRMYMENLWLHALNHMQFTLEHKSRYGIRSSSFEYSLSSIEAIAYSLEGLEKIPSAPLLQLLDAFKIQFTKQMPASVKQRYE